jgi:hypothetical protein
LINWLTALFNIGRRQPLLNMFGRRRNNRGIIWGPLLGLGISAAAYGLSRNRNKNMLRPLQNLMNNSRMEKSVQKPNLAGLTEFAKELVPNKKQFNNK